MISLLSIFKGVALIFTGSALLTGIQAIVDPVGFSRLFGLPIPSNASNSSTSSTSSSGSDTELTRSYVSLMGVRQLGMGVLLAIFVYDDKWTEVATVLAVIGFVVAGTDGFYLARSGNRTQARWHAIPGAVIALLAIGAVLIRV